jgi:hypothetical protein
MLLKSNVSMQMAILIHKQNTFKTATKTKKSVFLTFITTYGLTNNEYYRQLVQNSLSLGDLFLD